MQDVLVIPDNTYNVIIYQGLSTLYDMDILTGGYIKGIWSNAKYYGGTIEKPTGGSPITNPGSKIGFINNKHRQQLWYLYSYCIMVKLKFSSGFSTMSKLVATWKWKDTYGRKN